MDTKPLFSTWYIRLLIALVLFGACLALMAYTNLATKQAKYDMTGPTTIMVEGQGEVMAKPDIGQFSFSVMAEGADAVTAQDKSAESINAIVAYLSDNGVEEKDIKTQNYYLNPKYRYEERVCPAINSYCPPGDRVLDGYEVSQTIVVKVRDLDKAGGLISGVGERGAT
ncbi:SIMPL domain-containing protein, partial [Candidatus Kaiserbacteria bacterium]|nr:SIMPL domain-containing protein [Candidatus Kaiserbacteria bacterium]